MLNSYWMRQRTVKEDFVNYAGQIDIETIQ